MKNRDVSLRRRGRIPERAHVHRHAALDLPRRPGPPLHASHDSQGHVPAWHTPLEPLSWNPCSRAGSLPRRPPGCRLPRPDPLFASSCFMSKGCPPARSLAYKSRRPSSRASTELHRRHCCHHVELVPPLAPGAFQPPETQP
jgi:hypothetical protein